MDEKLLGMMMMRPLLFEIFPLYWGNIIKGRENEAQPSIADETIWKPSSAFHHVSIQPFNLFLSFFFFFFALYKLEFDGAKDSLTFVCACVSSASNSSFLMKVITRETTAAAAVSN